MVIKKYAYLAAASQPKGNPRQFSGLNFEFHRCLAAPRLGMQAQTESLSLSLLMNLGHDCILL